MKELTSLNVKLSQLEAWKNLTHSLRSKSMSFVKTLPLYRGMLCFVVFAATTNNLHFSMAITVSNTLLIFVSGKFLSSYWL